VVVSILKDWKKCFYEIKSLCNSNNKHYVAGSIKLAERWKFKIKYNRELICTYVYVYTHSPIIARFVNKC